MTELDFGGDVNYWRARAEKAERLVADDQRAVNLRDRLALEIRMHREAAEHFRKLTDLQESLAQSLRVYADAIWGVAKQHEHYSTLQDMVWELKSISTNLHRVASKLRGDE